MPFRGSDDRTKGVGLAEDPWRRFLALDAAFEARRGVFGDRVPRRLAAVALMGTPLAPAELATAVARTDAAMKAELGWFSRIDSSSRLLLSALLLKNEDAPQDFLAEFERVRALFRKFRLPRGGMLEVIAVAVMRRQLGKASITAAHVRRVKALYDEMKRYHWFLTGADDLPACALLLPVPRTPTEIGQGIEAVYQALRRHQIAWQGDPLQTAANILYLTGLSPTEIATRFVALYKALGAAGLIMGQSDYDEVALLCFVSLPVPRIVDALMEFRARLRSTLPSMDRAMAFSLAASITFRRLIVGHPRLSGLADLKLMLDMQTIIAARGEG